MFITGKLTHPTSLAVANKVLFQTPPLSLLHSHYGVMSIHRNLSRDDKSSLCSTVHSTISLLDYLTFSGMFPQTLKFFFFFLFNKWCLSLSQRLLCNELILLALKLQD